MGRDRIIPRRSLAPVDVEDRLSYIDTVRIDLPVGLKKDQFKRLRAELLAALRPHLSRYVPKKFSWKSGRWHWGLFIHQPSISVLEVLARTTTPFRICEVHVALDLLTVGSAEALALQVHVESLLLPSRRPGKLVEYAGRPERTTYFNKGVRRGSEVAIYSDKKSKPEPDRSCAHIDWRIKGAHELRKAGLSTPKDIASLNHRNFWDQRLALYMPPSTPRLKDARRRLLSHAPVVGPQPTSATEKLLKAVNRSCRGTDCRMMATNLLHVMNEHRWAFGPRSLRLFTRQSHGWMLPGDLNAMWRW